MSNQFFENAMWVIFGVAAAFIAFVLISAKRRTSRFVDSPPGAFRCEKCGYDLRATALVCPECGNRAPLHRVPLDIAKLRDEWTATSIAPAQYDYTPTYRLLWETLDGMLVSMFADQLRARGIGVFEDIERITEQRGGMSVQYPKYVIRVPEEEFDVATQILQRYRLGSDASDTRE